MPGPSRLFPDTYYHIYNRGINREDIFKHDRNYLHFLNLYLKYICPIADTYAYCFLINHFHLLVRIKSEAELHILPANQTGSIEYLPSRRFANLFNAYAKAINIAYGRVGNLFQHPFGRTIIKSDAQFSQVIAYIHQNPQKHGLIADFRDWKYSSYKIILSDQPTFLERETVLHWFGGNDAYQNLHAEWVNQLKRQ